MTRIDDTRVLGAAQIYRKYQELLRQVAQKENGRTSLLPDTKESKVRKQTDHSETMKMAEACRDFEALFIEQMLGEMRRGLREDSVFGDSSSALAADRNRNSFFRDQMYEGIAKDMAHQGGFGIGAVLFEQLYRQENPDLPPENKVSGDVARTKDSVERLLQQQRQALQQKQAVSLAQLKGHFYE